MFRDLQAVCCHIVPRYIWETDPDPAHTRLCRIFAIDHRARVRKLSGLYQGLSDILDSIPDDDTTIFNILSEVKIFLRSLNRAYYPPGTVRKQDLRYIFYSDLH